MGYTWKAPSGSAPIDCETLGQCLFTTLDFRPLRGIMGRFCYRLSDVLPSSTNIYDLWQLIPIPPHDNFPFHEKSPLTGGFPNRPCSWLCRDLFKLTLLRLPDATVKCQTVLHFRSWFVVPSSSLPPSLNLTFSGWDEKKTETCLLRVEPFPAS